MPDDYDVILTASVNVDNYHLMRDAAEVGAEMRRRLRREIEAKLPDGYALHDFEGEYRTNRNFDLNTTTFELRVYL